MRFICDVMLGKLAKRLRILGLDTIYMRSIADLAEYKMNGELAYFITRRKLQHTLYGNPVYLKSDKVTDQLTEIGEIILPYMSERDFMKRCIECNTLLADANKTDVEGFVPEFVFHKYNFFKTCPSCNRVYWEGTHVERMKEWIRKLKEPSGEQDGIQRTCFGAEAFSLQGNDGQAQ
jgi:uncharacterized protein with PIN domain